MEYDWQNVMDTKRKHQEDLPDPKDKRSCYEHDRSRIVHSVAFRRLQGKTQVFAPGWADFMRTRVTHAIEVAQIGRALANNAGIPQCLVEAACLAHDIGHPPFGHAGEDVLNDLMANHGGFEGNAQTFRILTHIERKSAKYRGLNLCRATLLGILKYPFRRKAHRSKYLYDEDATEYDDWLFSGQDFRLMSSETEKQDPRRSIVCQIMDWADDVAFSAHDLEDGLIGGFLHPLSFKEEHFAEAVFNNIQRSRVITKPDMHTVREILRDLGDRLGPYSTAPSRSNIREVTRYYINRFVTAVDVVAPNKPRSAFDANLEIPEDMRCECAVLKGINFEFVILDHRSTTFSFKGREILKRLYEALRDNTVTPRSRDRFTLFPRDMRDHLAEAQDNQSKLARLVCDYIASMTDGQALHLYSRLFEPTAGSPFETV